MGFVSLGAADGTPMALHQWAGDRSRAAIFYVHGMQSHAGWLFETGPALVARGIDLYALDRRGSGRSGGPRGHLPSPDAVLDDYQLAFEEVRVWAGLKPLIGLGQSFGGNLLAALLVSRPAQFDRIVLCTPALGHQRAHHSAAELAHRRFRAGTDLRDVPLLDRHYSDLPEYLSFMAADPLMLRRVTARTQAVQVLLEDTYIEGEGTRGLEAPVHLALGDGDPIIDADMVRRVARRLAPAFSEMSFPTSCHYLEFTDQRVDYWDWLASLAEAAAA